MVRLVDHQDQVKSLARNRVIVGKCPANGGKGLGTKGRVITLDANRLVEIKKDQGITA